MRDLFRSLDDGALGLLRKQQSLLQSVVWDAQWAKPVRIMNLAATAAAGVAAMRIEKSLGSRLADVITDTLRPRHLRAPLVESALDASFLRDGFKGMPLLRVDPLAAVSRATSALAFCQGAEQLLRIERFSVPHRVHSISVVEDVWRATRQLDAAMFFARGALKDAGVGTAVRSAPMAARALVGAMPMSAALRHAAAMRPHVATDVLAQALMQVHARPLGLASFAVGRAYPSLSSIAAQTLAALTVHELDGLDDAALDETPVAPLMQSLLELKPALDALPERAAAALGALTLPRAKSRVGAAASATLLFVGTVTGVLSLVVAVETREDARTASEAAARSESARAAEAARMEHARAEDAAHHARLLEELIELQRAATATTDQSRPTHTVQRKIVLRASRNNASQRLVALYPGDVVEVIERVGGQVRVRTCDYVRAQALVGWAPKKYLKRL